MGKVFRIFGQVNLLLSLNDHANGTAVQSWFNSHRRRIAIPPFSYLGKINLWSGLTSGSGSPHQPATEAAQPRL